MKHASTPKAPAEIPVAGIDVGKHSLVLGFSDGEAAGDYANDAAGRRALAEHLRRREVRRVGLESTGSYSQPIAATLRAAGFDVTVWQPGQVRAFAKFELRHAKNDKIDAYVIALATRMGRPQAAPDPRMAWFCEHLTAIDQITEDIAREKVRLEHVHDEALRDLHKQEIKRQTLRRRGLVTALGKAVRQHDDLRQRLELVLSIDGIGEITALALILRMPELGRLSRGQAAALLGVAPFDNESGRYKGERSIAGGRARARRSLFAAAQAACRQWNRALIDLYDRLRAKGHHHVYAVVACTRKLVIYANTVLERQKPWTKNVEAKRAL